MLDAPVDASEVAKHSTSEDCWIIVDSKIYDISGYIDDHPGGDSILKNAGGDSSEGVHGPQHPPSMWDVLRLYYIGDLKM
ncbi:cytochrome b5-like heme/steroid binding domain-containing protein [Ochromonadaceae sp. CCMP2298]|nr:cytochrome b5-like heme/steroid binding domain-containing protein [Ochromonadaceae sp. CCMP2298]